MSARTDLVIHDLASVLCDIDPKTKNRKEIFVKTLQSLVRFAITENYVEQINGERKDMARVNEILARSKI